MSIIFETGRMIVRPWTVDDTDAAFEIFGDAEVMRYVGSTGKPHPDAEVTRQRLATLAATEFEPGRGNWAAIERSTGMVIGGCGLGHLDELAAVEVFYHLRRDRWGMGYGAELARGAIGFGFASGDLERIIGLAYPANVASHRVMRSAGMTHLGRVVAYGVDLEYFAIERATAVR